MAKLKHLFWLTLLLFNAAAALALSPADARHLLERTGFGVSPGEMREMLPLTWEQAVDRLLLQTRTTPRVAPPELVSEQPPDPKTLKDMTREQRRELEKQISLKGSGLKEWWMREMLATDSPLTERMTLFWSNHFTSEMRKVRWPPILYRQNALLRREALGNYGRLLHGIVSDPAMLIYLDGAASRKGKPNENFAREVLELFSLGEGHYSERDIKEGARAFTGWTVDRRTASSTLNPKLHDDGEKTFMGESGPWGDQEVVNIILAQPQTAKFIVEKLWREFISETPDPQEVERMAKALRWNGYEIKPLLRAMLLSPQFRDARNRGALVKSPVELVVGTLRTFEIPVADTRPLVEATRRLGQDIMDPPNVKGWPGGAAWINSDSLILRRQLLEKLLRPPVGKGGGRGRGPVQRVGEAGGNQPLTANIDAWVESMPESGCDEKYFEQMLLAVRPVGSEAGKGGELSEAVVRLALDPAYQLK